MKNSKKYIIIVLIVTIILGIGALGFIYNIKKIYNIFGGFYSSEGTQNNGITDNKKINENNKEFEIETEKGNNQKYQTEYVKENTKVLDDNGNTLIIPKGFKMLPDEGTTVQEGIVIQDIDENEFVWIPVGEIKNADGSTTNIELARYTFNEDGTIKNKIIDGRAIIAEETKYIEFESSSSIERLEELNNEGKKLLMDLSNDIKEFKASVKKYGGYYLARYEASYRDQYRPYSKKATKIRRKESPELTEGMLWDEISWLDAVKVSKEMYNGFGVKSFLVNSYAWDTAITYIQKVTGNTGYAVSEGNGYSYDAYSGLRVDSDNPIDKVCNIFDMASNYAELTTELTEYDGYPHEVCLRSVFSGRRCACIRQGNVWKNSRWCKLDWFLLWV